MNFVLSLFPGIGLLDHAFELEGYCVVRGPDVLWGGDIRIFHPPAGKFDGVIGGPPCQVFSKMASLVRYHGYEPKFGNLIPEFERCVSEADPDWFLMENVPAAPEPSVPEYQSKSFLLDNSALAGEHGFGLEQRRLRRFTFGRRGQDASNLLRWINMATFLLPILHETPCGHGPAPGQRVKSRKATVTSSHGGKSVRMTRYSLADTCRLQGLPENFLADSPFTADGKLKAVANGVPIQMGRAIAKAIKQCIQEVTEAI